MLNFCKVANSFIKRTFYSFFFFSSFDKNQLANIHWYRWNKRLKISKLIKCKGKTLKAGEVIAPQSGKIVVHELAPPYKPL